VTSTSRSRAKEYYRNAAGQIIPSTTTVLGAVLAKPALVKWANRLGLQGVDSDKYKDELADIGILTHYFIMCRLSDEVPDVSNFTPAQVEQAQACYLKYIDWEEKNPVRPLMVEERLVSEKYQYGGQPDLYALSNGKFILVDFKTNAKGIFDEMVFQVAAYEGLLIEHGFKVNEATMLRIGRSDPEGFEEKILTRSELDLGFEIFLRCLDIYQLKRGKAPICTTVNR